MIPRCFPILWQQLQCFDKGREIRVIPLLDVQTVLDTYNGRLDRFYDVRKRRRIHCAGKTKA